MSFKLLFLGDVMLGENFHHINRGIRTRFSSNYSSIFKGDTFANLISSRNIILFNMEYSVVPDGFSFNSISESVYASDASSLDLFPVAYTRVANIANNHFSQHGAERSNFTKKLLIERGFKIIGTDNSPLVLTDSTDTLKIWGVSLVSDKYFNGSYFKSSYDKLIDDLSVKSLKKLEGEKWIISIHWGDEYIKHPNTNQTKLAKELAELGFDFVIGHHPHVYQSYEKYNDTHIFYSLGNFIFDQNFSKATQEGLACSVDIDSGKSSLSSVQKIVSKDYFISKVYSFPISKLKYMPPSVFVYKSLRYLNRYKMRILMKYELVKNWKEVDATVKSFFKKKIFG